MIYSYILLKILCWIMSLLK